MLIKPPLTGQPYHASIANSFHGDDYNARLSAKHHQPYQRTCQIPTTVDRPPTKSHKGQLAKPPTPSPLRKRILTSVPSVVMGPDTRPWVGSAIAPELFEASAAFRSSCGAPARAQSLTPFFPGRRSLADRGPWGSARTHPFFLAAKSVSPMRERWSIGDGVFEMFMVSIGDLSLFLYRDTNRCLSIPRLDLVAAVE